MSTKTIYIYLIIHCKISDQESDDDIASINSKDNDDDATYDISEASRDDMRPRMAPDGGNPTEPDNPTRDRPTRS